MPPSYQLLDSPLSHSFLQLTRLRDVIVRDLKVEISKTLTDNLFYSLVLTKITSNNIAALISNHIL